MFLGGIIGVIVSFQFSLTVAFRATTSFTISASYHQLSLPQKIRPIANIHFAPTQRLFMNNNNNKDNDIIEYNDFDDEEIVALVVLPDDHLLALHPHLRHSVHKLASLVLLQVLVREKSYFHNPLVWAGAGVSPG